MKQRASTLTLCAVCGLLVTLALPAWASVVYDNGPISGQIDSWTINFGFVVSDSFTVSGGPSTITGLSFGTWAFGDVLESVEVSITSNEFGGTTYFDQVVSTTQSDCHDNQYGYQVCLQSARFDGPTLTNGAYWLNLQNAVDNIGGLPIFWDENSGAGCQSPGCPSQASTWLGTIPSESFTLLGTTSGSGTVPESGSLLLLGSGVIGSLGVLRRELGLSQALNFAAKERGHESSLLDVDAASWSAVRDRAAGFGTDSL